MAQLEEAAAPFEPAEVIRSHVSYSELRQSLKKYLDWVVDSRAPLYVMRGKSEPVVMLALSEYESIEETLHLLRNPVNAAHLLEALRQAAAGEFVEADAGG